MDYNNMDLSSTNSAALSGLINEHNATDANKVAQNYSSGISEGRGLLNRPDNINQTLSYGNDATSNAIKSKYSQQYGLASRELSTKTMMQAHADQIQKLTVASQLADQEVQMNREKALLIDKKKQANKHARGAVLGHVLGIVGGVVAGAYTGGAAAPAGFMAGEAAGNAIGGS